MTTRQSRKAIGQCRTTEAHQNVVAFPRNFEFLTRSSSVSETNTEKVLKTKMVAALI